MAEIHALLVELAGLSSLNSRQEQKCQEGMGERHVPCYRRPNGQRRAVALRIRIAPGEAD